MLTETKIRNEKPRAAAFKLTDGGGLHLLVRPNGSKLWQVRYTYAGKEKTLSLGPYPAVGLADARDRRDAAKRTLSEGHDPNIAKAVAKAAAIVAAGITFEHVARQWHQTNESKWSETHTGDVLHSLETLVFPAIGALPIDRITPAIVLGVIRAIEARPAIETAKRVRQRMSAIFEFGIALQVCQTDPASMIRTLLKPLPTPTKQPAITDLAKLREMLAAVEAMPAHPVTKLATRMIALTVVRPGTLHGTPWSEFANIGTDTIWRIPSDRMKMDREFWIPLSTQVLDVIEALKPITGRGPLAFPNDRWSHRPMSENAMLYLLRRTGYGGQHCPHGWRASFHTIMAERYQGDATVNSVLDTMLAHAKNSGPYNRAEYLDRRRELAQEWADLLLAGFPPASSLMLGPRR
jgi:integrase